MLVARKSLFRDSLEIVSALIAGPFEQERNLHGNVNQHHKGNLFNFSNGEWSIHILQCSVLLDI